MATPQEKLAYALEALKELQASGVVAIRTSDLTRVHREVLLKNTFLKEVMKGWYIAAPPDERAGDSTSWYASFWAFCAAYLNERFGENWCLSPEHSLSLHAGNRVVPEQLLVRSPKGGNKVTKLPYNTSLFDVRANMPAEKDIEEKEDLRLFSLPAALIACSRRYYDQNSTDVRATLTLIRDASDVLDRLLEGGHSTIAGRLAGAFRNIGRNRIANDIVNAMHAAGYIVREHDPFRRKIDLVLPRREVSPFATRIRLMWQQMRDTVIERFPEPPGKPKNIDAYLKHVDEVYVADAYHSLSIEGYQVSPKLIEHIRSGNWNPENVKGDREHHNALAAKGYWQAYQAVQKSLVKVLRGSNPGTVVEEDHGTWYREMFAPSAAAGLIRTTDLAGYRNGPVFIRHSMHIPPNRDAVRDAMPVFFEMLTEEAEPAVRLVLGHFIFVYIHPYTDGNGRMARFLMNTMMAAGGYPWTIVPLQQRDAYMSALEKASVYQTITPFTEFLAQLTEKGLGGKVVAYMPKN